MELATRNLNSKESATTRTLALESPMHRVTLLRVFVSPSTAGGRRLRVTRQESQWPLRNA